MLLLIIIFFAVVIVVGASVIAGFSLYLKSRTERRRLKNQRQFNDQPPPYRSLFAPDEAEIRASEQAQIAELTAKSRTAARLSAAKKIRAAHDFLEVWKRAPDKAQTVELFRLAARSENAATFSETAESVIEFRRKNEIANLSAGDLADLLDSHLATLPQQERTAGALFWLRREIMSLRAAASE